VTKENTCLKIIGWSRDTAHATSYLGAGERIYQCSSCVAGDDDSVVDLRDALPVLGERAGVRRGEVHDEKHRGAEITVTYLCCLPLPRVVAVDERRR
jgi:hypothetical protein